jgi:hypothetical protein
MVLRTVLCSEDNFDHVQEVLKGHASNLKTDGRTSTHDEVFDARNTIIEGAMSIRCLRTLGMSELYGHQTSTTTSLYVPIPQI